MSAGPPTGDGQTGRVIDVEFWDRYVIAKIRLLATPPDFDDLIARGILKKARPGWYWLLVPLRDLPDDLSYRIAAASFTPKGMKVRFWSSKEAAKVAGRLGIEIG